MKNTLQACQKTISCLISETLSKYFQFPMKPHLQEFKVFLEINKSIVRFYV